MVIFWGGGGKFGYPDKTNGDPTLKVRFQQSVLLTNTQIHTRIHTQTHTPHRKYRCLFLQQKKKVF